MIMKLLIVEDSAPIRASLLGLLEGIEGLGTVHTAASLAQALDIVRRESPGLVILDLQLPDGNAMHQIGTMKALSPATRIAVLTNDANQFVRDKCLKAGANWFFDKSTEFEKVIAVAGQQARWHLADHADPRPAHA
jgi:DNA-binding NarL/FixJ family response regulator